MPLDGSVKPTRRGAQRWRERPAPRVRRPDFDFSRVPKHWFGGSVFGTHMSNGLNVLFPDGERFFVRSVHHYLDQLEDPELRASVKAFFGQEGAHAREHQATFDILRAQGLDPDKFLRRYRYIAFKLLEPRFSPAVRLAVTAACEHFTASFAHNGLSTNDMEAADPIMRELLYWHAAEEIEHKSVAFDVFEEVDGRYPVRVAGMVAAMIILTSLWTMGVVSFLRQDEEATPRRIFGEVRRALQSGRIGKFKMARMFVDYMRRDFHPDDVDDYALAQDYLASVGMQPAGVGDA